MACCNFSPADEALLIEIMLMLAVRFGEKAYFCVLFDCKSETNCKYEDNSCRNELCAP